MTLAACGDKANGETDARASAAPAPIRPPVPANDNTSLSVEPENRRLRALPRPGVLMPDDPFGPVPGSSVSPGASAPRPSSSAPTGIRL